MSRASSISRVQIAAPGHTDTTPHGGWCDRALSELVVQHPLLETRPSLHALRRGARRPPSAVFVGIGVAAGDDVSRALPLDVLGLLLAAEDVRRTCGADHLVVLLADAHAVAHGAPWEAVRARTAAYARSLRRVAERCRLREMKLVLASELHTDPAYRRTLQRVEACAPEGTDPYVTREVADIAHLDHTLDGVLKVGWALQASEIGARRDERMFDERFREWVGREVSFLYAKAGRVLDDGHRKGAPYLEQQPARRICLSPDENVAGKLARARGEVSKSTWRGVRNHMSSIARTYGKIVRPLRGSLETRVQVMIDELSIEPSTERRAQPASEPPAFYGA